MIRILSNKDYSTAQLANIALDNHLYYSTLWCLYSCLEDVTCSETIENHSDILILLDNDNPIGVVYHNNTDTDFSYGTTIQIFIAESHRNQGYGKLLYTEMNKLLVEKQIRQPLLCGAGIEGSTNFWIKMADYFKLESDKFLPLGFV